MNAPAQVTEAHLKLAHEVQKEMNRPGHRWNTAAQLLADSEARAVSAADFALQQERNIHMTTIAERDEAILGKLQELHGCSQEMVVYWAEHAVKRSYRLIKVQTELGSLHGKIGLLANELTTISDNAPTEDCIAAIRESFKAMLVCVEITGSAKKESEAELAKEREKAERYRLATLRQDSELAKERARLDHVIARLENWRGTRDAIDAAMKEDSK